MVDVVELSQRMLNCFETTVVGKPFSEQIVGKVLACPVYDSCQFLSFVLFVLENNYYRQ
jgi:hypothetical protein